MDNAKDAVDISDLIEGCRRNHRPSQQKLHGLFFNYAMSIARRYMHNLDLAEEVTNDAFLKVFIKIDLFHGNQPFRPWLRRIVVNTAIDRLRANIHLHNEVPMQTWHESVVVDGVEEQITQQQIWDMLDSLPPGYRAVFNLAVIDGFTHEEIAETLGISVGASKSNLSRARQHLKRLLKAELDFI